MTLLTTTRGDCPSLTADVRCTNISSWCTDVTYNQQSKQTEAPIYKYTTPQIHLLAAAARVTRLGRTHCEKQMWALMMVLMTRKRNSQKKCFRDDGKLKSSKIGLKVVGVKKPTATQTPLSERKSVLFISKAPVSRRHSICHELVNVLWKYHNDITCTTFRKSFGRRCMKQKTDGFEEEEIIAERKE